MMMTIVEQSTCPPGVLGWIAWYPDGLADEQRGAVEAHAAECAGCREELEFLHGNAAPPIQAPDPERIYAQVLARIESGGSSAAKNTTAAQQAPAEQAAESNVRGIQEASGWRRVETRPLLALAASVLVALAVGTGIGRTLDGTAETVEPAEPVYHTASAPPVEPTSGLPALEVVFHEDADVSRISQSLRQLDAQITGGPSQVGVYRLELPAGADIAAAGKLLKGDLGVAIFAERPLQP